MSFDIEFAFLVFIKSYDLLFFLIVLAVFFNEI